MTPKPIRSAASTGGAAHKSTASSVHPFEEDEITKLCGCDDILACRQEPSCESFLQIVRLIETPDFEKKPGGGRKGGNGTVFDPFKDRRTILVQASAEFIADRIRRHVRFTVPTPAPTPSSGKTGKKMKRGPKTGALVVPDAMPSFGQLVSMVRERMKSAADSSFAMRPVQLAGFLPPALCSDIELVMVVRFEQCWMPLGYSRGDLLSSVSLAPGEEQTLEVFTYDRHRVERERARESSQESGESASITARASSEVVSQQQFKMNAGVTTKTHAELSLAGMELPIDVGGEIGTEFGSELSNALTSTTSQLNEATRQSSNTLRSLQKTRIVETSETGTEKRSTRRIRNENRCHTLNFFYFEILEHFDVRVKVAEVQMAARVPLPAFGQITPSWLLCHEHPLRRSLLDPVYEQGFDAARLLQSAAAFKVLTRQTSPPARGSRRGGASDPVTDELRELLDGITAAAETLFSATPLNGDEMWRMMFGEEPLKSALQKRQSQCVTKEFLQAQIPGLFDRIDELKAKRDKSGVELFTAFDLCMSQLLSAGLDSVLRAFMAGGPVALVRLYITAVNVSLFGYDDCGLLPAISAARRRLDALRGSVRQASAASVAGPSAESQPQAEREPTAEERIDREFGLRNLAEAQVEYDRLVCHIQSNLDHYQTVVFIGEGSAAWRNLLEDCPQVIGMVEPRLLAVQDGHAFFPLRRQAQEQRQVTLARRRVEELNKEMADKPGQHVTLSTGGAKLEASLGLCSACETFIEKHREHDLAIKREEVKQAAERTRLAAAEADRQEARLAQSPPILDDPAADQAALRLDVRTSPFTAPAP